MFSVILRDLALALACLTCAGKPAVSSAHRRGRVLVVGRVVVRYLVASDGDPVYPVEDLVVSLSRALAVGTSDHPYLLSTAGAVITAVSCTNRTAHTSASLRTDQSIHATNPANAERMTERMSLSTIDITRLPIDSIANTPAKIVRRRLAKKPMTFRKVFDTFDSISDDLSVVKLYDVYSLISMRKGR